MNPEQQATVRFCREIQKGNQNFSSKGYLGKGYSPRSIEVPWAASHMKDIDVMLDVGFSLASLDYLRMLLDYKDERGVSVEAVDIVEPEKVKNRYPREWLESVLSVPIIVGDVRKVSLPENKYDVVACISTIEHIGYDLPSSTVRGSAFERQSDRNAVNRNREANVNRDVMNSFHKALKPGGISLISAPMGRGGPLVSQDSLGLYSVEWEYEAKSWQEIVGDKRFEIVEGLFFKNSPEGWFTVSSPSDLAEVSGEGDKMGVGLAMTVLRKK